MPEKTPIDRAVEHAKEASAWLDGSRSHWNEINDAVENRDVAQATCLVADAQTAAAHAAASQAWVAVADWQRKHGVKIHMDPAPTAEQSRAEGFSAGVAAGYQEGRRP